MLPLVRARVGPDEGFLVVVGGGTEGILALQGLDGVEVCNECTYARIREYHTMHMCVYVHSYTQKASWPCKAWRVLRHSCMNVHTRARTHTHTHKLTHSLSLSLSRAGTRTHVRRRDTTSKKQSVRITDHLRASAFPDQAPAGAGTGGNECVCACACTCVYVCASSVSVCVRVVCLCACMCCACVRACTCARLR